MTKYLITPVVLCGGSGTRLWPLSRLGFPKQFLILSGTKSLFQQTIARIQNIVSNNIDIEETLIVTNEEHRFLVLEQLRDIEAISAKLILEPLGRNTAPALTLAALQALSHKKDPILFVTPADHRIKNEEVFVETIHRGIKVAEQGAFVVLGIKPNRPDTGFGYIKQHGVKGKNKEFDVLGFKEKPDLDTAKQYLKNDNYTWNSGIFLVKASVWLDLLRQFRSDILETTRKAFEAHVQDDLFIRPNDDFFQKVPSESIDYAVIEKLPGKYPLKVISLDVGWDDLGSWDAVWESEEKDHQGNVIYGDNILYNTKNSLIYSSNRLVATSGLKDIVVIETADSVMVLNRNESQSVKLIVNQLISKKREEENLHRKVFRPWGWFDRLDQGDRFKVKRIQVNPGASLSLQKHTKRAEHWIVVKGSAQVTCENKTFILKENESTYIPLGTTHKLSNPGIEILEIIEVQSGNYLGEDDIERFEDSYGRTK